EDFDVSAVANVTFSEGGYSDTVTRSTDGTTTPAGNSNSGPATKYFVDAAISIADDGVNEVGESHDFTVTVNAYPGAVSGVSFDAITVVISPIPDSASTTCGTPVVSGDTATCTVTISNDHVEDFSVSAVANVTFSEGAYSETVTRSTDGTTTPADNINSGPATKYFVDAYIRVEPSAVNGIGEAHTFNITAVALPGDVGGVTFDYVNATVSDPSKVVEDTCSSPTVSGDTATCSVTVLSDVPTTVTANAEVSITFSEGGSSDTVIRSTSGNAGPGGSGPATKQWIAGSLRWYKVDGKGDLLGGAIFEVCHTFDRFGEPIADGCFYVEDNVAPDADPADGKFLLQDLKLGTYTVREHQAPEGYFGDLLRTETVVLSIESPNEEIGEPWINERAGQLTPTGTTCEDFRDGVAGDLTEVEYRTKDGLINNTAPGVFFYYTKFRATESSFVIDVAQTNDQDPMYDFFVQNASQVRLYTADCGTPAVDWNFTINGQVSLNIGGATPGDAFILSIKYETGNITGLAAPNPQTIHYDFATYLTDTSGWRMVDMDEDGLDLLFKGGD
ncbi:MAG: prealbumin-like fold domain-containing protein, partial [Chloroflexota bacterium]